jgi:hypothetical protein
MFLEAGKVLLAAGAIVVWDAKDNSSEDQACIAMSNGWNAAQPDAQQHAKYAEHALRC